MLNKQKDIEKKVYIQMIDELTNRCNMLERKLVMESRFKNEYETLCKECKNRLKEVDELKEQYFKSLEYLKRAIKALER